MLLRLFFLLLPNRAIPVHLFSIPAIRPVGQNALRLTAAFPYLHTQSENIIST